LVAVILMAIGLFLPKYGFHHSTNNMVFDFFCCHYQNNYEIQKDTKLKLVINFKSLL